MTIHSMALDVHYSGSTRDVCLVAVGPEHKGVGHRTECEIGWKWRVVVDSVCRIQYNIVESILKSPDFRRVIESPL